jgi:hypothetical protein
VTAEIRGDNNQPPDLAPVEKTGAFCPVKIGTQSEVEHARLAESLVQIPALPLAVHIIKNHGHVPDVKGYRGSEKDEQHDRPDQGEIQNPDIPADMQEFLADDRPGSRFKAP